MLANSGRCWVQRPTPKDPAAFHYQGLPLFSRYLHQLEYKVLHRETCTKVAATHMLEGAAEIAALAARGCQHSPLPTRGRCCSSSQFFWTLTYMHSQLFSL